jgi:hypothetical protein
MNSNAKPTGKQWKKWEIQHDYPIEHEFEFLKSGVDINDGPNAGRWLPDTFHQMTIHGGKSGSSFGGIWNDQWRKFFDAYGKAGRAPTKAEIEAFRDAMRSKTSDFTKALEEIIWPDIKL